MKARPAPPSILSALHTVGSQGLFSVKQLTSSGEIIERLPIHPQELGTHLLNSFLQESRVLHGSD